jgi:uncharacterized protein
MGQSTRDAPTPPSLPSPADTATLTCRRGHFLARHAWLSFVAPMIVFLLVGSLEPTASKPGAQAIGLAITYRAYPLVYAIKIAAVLATLVLVWPGYREFPCRASAWSPVLGVAGAAIWIVLCRAEQWLLEWLGFGWLVDFGARAAFDPFAHWAGRPLMAGGFIALRLIGLALIVPLIEEFFLRGFLVRFVTAADWRQVKLAQASRLAIAVSIAAPMLWHPPSELLAAAVWFSLMAWWMLRTGNLWDCVLAHAATNLTMGLYVLYSGQWQLW